MKTVPKWSGAPSPFTEVEWTEPMLSLLIELRKSGHPIDTCAAQIGVCDDTCRKKLKELGLNQRMNRGRIKGIHADFNPRLKLR